MKISYLVTCSIETKTLSNLLYRLDDFIDDNDEILIMQDMGNTNEKTTEIIVDKIKNRKHCINHINLYRLNNDYSAHKNTGMKLADEMSQKSGAKSDFIFQIDGDELPSEMLLENIKDIISANPDVEAFWIPRINDFRGVTLHHAKQWGWVLTPSSSVINEKIIDTNSEEYKFLKNNGYILEETKI